MAEVAVYWIALYDLLEFLKTGGSKLHSWRVANIFGRCYFMAKVEDFPPNLLTVTNSGFPMEFNLYFYSEQNIPHS